MRFFSRRWCEGLLDEHTHAMILREYWEHIDAISCRLPVALREFASPEGKVNLHDGLIRSVLVDTADGSIEMSLRCGDLQVGHYDVNLRYSSVSIETPLLEAIRNVVDESTTAILYDEVDVNDDQAFEHRIIFEPRGEVAIEFRGFSFTKVDVPSRKFMKESPVLRIK